MEDELQDVRERFFIGAYASAIEYCERIPHKLNEILESEKNSMLNRSYLSTGKFSKLKNLRDSEEASLRSIANFAIYLKAK